MKPKRVATLDNILNKISVRWQFCVLFIEIIFTQRDETHQN
jgi:hypothetical protein